MKTWARGDYLTHRSNPELGIGRVVAVSGRTLDVVFASTGARLRLAANTDALVGVDLSPGRRVRVAKSHVETTIIATLDDGRLQLADGTMATADTLWPLALEGALLDRLLLGEVDSAVDVLLRLEMLRLRALREAGGLGSFLGGRIRLFPHQLYVAERASATHPVRWLLADEVGLGKTIEASLILNRLVHTGDVERVLVVTPESLTVQWLGELWRKYHHVFTLLDTQRLEDVARDFGADFNPFDVHRRVVCAIETLVARPELTRWAVEAGIDLLIVDEAQRLRRPPGHPGEPAWRAIAPIAALRRHVLLLSATPLEDDAHGFFRLLQLLRPDEFPEGENVEARLASGVPLPPCTSSTRRTDIGGLPPRVGMPVDLELRDSRAREAMESTLRQAPAANAVQQRQKIDRLRRALSSGAALKAGLHALGVDDGPLRQACDAMDGTDPRVQWLVARARRWRDAGDKTLVFVERRETLEMLRAALSDRAQLASGTFHEELPAARRDTEVARFREPQGPSLLISTEAGGEGRNFEFCRRLVLFDLPWRPTVVEQRIGRLDRIGRTRPVEVLYFRPPRGIGRDVVRLFEELGVFREPLAGLEPQLAHVEGAIEALALEPDARLSNEQLQATVAEAQAARSRIHEAAYQQLHRDPYRPEMAAQLLARLPADLDALNEQVVTTACARLGLTVERTRGRAVYAIELGHDALVESLPGVPGGSTFVGSFERQEAVDDESVDFFASGHPLVEGVFAHWDDSPLGRVAQLEVAIDGEPGEGLVAVYKDGAEPRVVALDRSGPRPDWSAAFNRRPLRARGLRQLPGDRERWKAMIRALGEQLDPALRPQLIAAVVFRSRPVWAGASAPATG